jgi:hypothetical protein
MQRYAICLEFFSESEIIALKIHKYINGIVETIINSNLHEKFLSAVHRNAFFF